MIKPSPENAKLYRPVDPSDPEVIALAESIKKHGILEPLVITKDNYIVSGHRRHTAAKLAGLKTVPVKVRSVSRLKNRDRFITVLREYNRYRIKGHEEKLREEVISAEPTEKYRGLVDHRLVESVVTADTLKIREGKKRCKISGAKQPFLKAVMDILEKYERYWPLSVRRGHYYLLNDPPLKHASKPQSIYRNDQKSYRAMDELTVRARLEGGWIEWDAIDDETRPVVTWNVHDDVQAFLRGEIDGFLKGYYRNLMASQPNHIEILGEKMTVGPIIKPVASTFCIPYTLGRGFASLPVRQKMFTRFQDSGKEHLVLLIVSDHDPDGEEIAHSFARSMQQDFGVWDIKAIKVALTREQVEAFDLPSDNLTEAKTTSPNYKRFFDKYGSDAYELEAIEPADLQELLTEAVESVIDVDAFNAEIDAEKEDVKFLDATRAKVHKRLADLTG